MSNKPNRKPNKTQWYRADLHLHTIASADYQEPGITYLDILRRGEMRGLDIMAFTDHNTVNGYASMMREIETLEMLGQRERATPEERRRLAEYRRLLDKILVLPGFEFTATFGFHILGIFSPDAKIRQIEHTLLSLNIPAQALDEGNPAVGASSDVLSAYRAINEAGGLVIAAHANSAHGVAMRGFDFGGQTRIAYTQDPYLHCLEVTDLDRRGRGTTARFFDGTKPEYPRRMRCIQGSDAHRLAKDPRVEKNLGIGDRITEFLLPERSFDSLRDLLRGNDFARSRPYYGTSREVYDFVHSAREAGPSIVQAFHDSMARAGGRLYGIIADICAFANTNGGTIYIGVSTDMGTLPVGVSNIGESIEVLKTEIAHRINPQLEVEIDVQETSGKSVIRIQVPRGDDPPYAIDDNKIYVREEAETSLAVRDEIVQLVKKNAQVVAAVAAQTAQAAAPAHTTRAGGQPSGRGGRRDQSRQTQQRMKAVEATPVVEEPPVPVAEVEPEVLAPAELALPPALVDDAAEAGMSASQGGNQQHGSSRRERGGRRMLQRPMSPRDEALLSNSPRTGVEIVGTETRKGERYHVMRDLRDGKLVKNVTRSSARRLWHYAITELENSPVELDQVQWNGNVGLWKRYKHGGVVRYDLVLSENGSTRIFYGVTEDGMHGPWQQFISEEPVEIVADDEPESNN